MEREKESIKGLFSSWTPDRRRCRRSSRAASRPRALHPLLRRLPPRHALYLHRSDVLVRLAASVVAEAGAVRGLLQKLRLVLHTLLDDRSLTHVYVCMSVRDEVAIPVVIPQIGLPAPQCSREPRGEPPGGPPHCPKLSGPRCPPCDPPHACKQRQCNVMCRLSLRVTRHTGVAREETRTLANKLVMLGNER